MHENDAGFGHSCSQSVCELRSSLVELCDEIGVDASEPQEVSRQLGVNKTLTWSVSRLIHAADNLQAVHHVPGTAALEKLLRAASKKGATPRVVARVRGAALEFQRVVEAHVGDRATLDLVLDAIPDSDGRSLELSRKLAYRGSSGIFGLQAQTRLCTYFLTPNRADPRRLDIATVNGYIGFRRLRPAVTWPIFKVRAWSDADEPIASGAWESFEVLGDGALTISVRRGSDADPLPEIREVTTAEGTDYMLMPGPIGNAAAFDCFNGKLLHSAASRFTTGSEDIGECGAIITTPSARLILDLLVHRDLDFVLSPELLVFGTIATHRQRTGSRDDATLLPIRQHLVQLAGSPPAVATPSIPGYTKLVKTVYKAMNMEPGDVRGVRLDMNYPPLGSHIVLRFQLPDPPATAGA